MQAENAENLDKEAGQEENPPKVKRGKAGAPRGNRNAAKVGEDLRVELFLSKPRRMFLEEWFILKFGRAVVDEDELREVVRKWGRRKFRVIIGIDN